MILCMMATYLLLMLFFAAPASHQQKTHMFESSTQLTEFGTAFEPRHPIELLSTICTVPSLVQCAMQCNQNVRCRTCDYDKSSRVCRLFEGEFSTGTLLNNSTLSSSRVISILHDTADAHQSYSAYNETCDQCGVGINRYLQCINNTCQCPPNTYWNGRICLNQKYNGSSCNFSSECRQDLNLTCSTQTRTCTVSKPAGTDSLSGAYISVVAY